MSEPAMSRLRLLDLFGLSRMIRPAKDAGRLEYAEGLIEALRIMTSIAAADKARKAGT